MPAARYWRAIDLETHGGGELELSAFHLYSGDSNGDTNYNSVSLLLHGDGANASTTFTDNSSVPKTVTAVGNAQISTAQSKFSGSAMYFDGTGDYLTIPDSTAFTLGASDFTVEMWIYPTNASAGTDIVGVKYQCLIGQNQIGDSTNASFVVALANMKPISAMFYSGTNPGSPSSPTALAVNTWYHIAYVRWGSTAYLYVDGILKGSAAITTATDDSSRVFAIASDSTGASPYQGYIDDVRVTIGVARYTAAFIPPVSAFANTDIPFAQTRADETATLTSTYAPVSGLLANLQDADLNTVARFDTSPPRFALQWDFGSGNTADISTVVPGSSSVKDDFLSRCILQYSDDTYLWNTATSFGQHVWPGANTMVEVSAAVGDPSFANVALLLHGNGANGATTITDNSPAPKTVTAYGNAQISTTQSKFGGASMYFDGAGDYLSILADTGWTFGTGAFTVEFSVVVAAFGSCLCSNITTNIGNTEWSIVIQANGTVKMGSWNTNYVVGATVVSVGAWNHIAWTSDGTNNRLFVNGVLQGTYSTAINLSATSALYIGKRNLSTYEDYFNGYIDDFRITKGVARYTANFTPPTEQFPDIFGQPAVVSDANYTSVTLLLHGDGANGSTTFTDNSPAPKTVTAYGNAQISTTQSKFGGSSMYFDGTGDYLSIPAANNTAMLEFGLADFTVEAFLFIAADSSSSSKNSTIYASNFPTSGAITTGQSLSVLGNGSITGTGLEFDFFPASGPGFSTICNTSISKLVWHHIAIVRASGVMYMFLDGVRQTLAANADPITSVTSITNGGAYPTTLGKTNYTGYEAYLNGYIDDFRITKGVARYTANFTPPTSAFGNVLPTSTMFEALPSPILNSSQLIAFPGSTPPSSGVGNAPSDWATRYDPYHGGIGRIVGTVKEKHLPDNAPLGRKVWLMDEASKMVIRETWSDVTTGAYEFTGIRMGTKYAVFAYDYTGAYRAVIADNQEATL